MNVPPLPARPLLGRDALLADLADRLIAGQSPALSTAGMPGVGKTSLAVALAHHRRVLEHFSDGVLWAGLGPQPDVVSIQADWAAALGVDISGIADLEARRRVLCNALGQRRALIIIDDAWDENVARRLRCGGRTTTLLTTRNDNIARGFAPAAFVSVPELEQDPSEALLRSLAPEAWAAAPKEMRKLAQMTGGLPLALEVLGGYLGQAEHSAFPELIQQALEALQDPGQWLALSGHRVGDAAEASLDAVIALSVENVRRIHPAAARAFDALGAFAPKPARFSLEAAMAVTEADAATLARLIAHNLLAKDGDDLTLHQALAAAAAARCPAAARQRHREYYLAQVREDKDDWQRIAQIYPQLSHAQAHLPPEDASHIEFVGALSTYQTRRGLWVDRRRWLAQALATAHTTKDVIAQACMLNEYGYVYAALGEMPRALTYYNRALKLVRQVGGRDGEAVTLNNIGHVYDALGEKQKALEYYNQALELYRQVGDRWGERITRFNMAVVFYALGEYDHAVAQLEIVVALDEAMGHPDLESDRAVLARVRKKRVQSSGQ